MSGINDLFDDANSKAVRKWDEIYYGDPNFKMEVSIKKPFKIIFNDEIDYSKLLFVLNKYKIKYDVIDLKTINKN